MFQKSKSNRHLKVFQNDSTLFVRDSLLTTTSITTTTRTSRTTTTRTTTTSPIEILEKVLVLEPQDAIDVLWNYVDLFPFNEHSLLLGTSISN